MGPLEGAAGLNHHLGEDTYKLETTSVSISPQRLDEFNALGYAL